MHYKLQYSFHSFYRHVYAYALHALISFLPRNLFMPQSYTPEFKKKIVRLHEEEGRTYKSITAEYGVSKASISKWCSEFSKECQSSPEAKEDYDNMKEMLRLKRENEELRKENLFLKKAAAFFAKEID